MIHGLPLATNSSRLPVLMMMGVAQDASTGRGVLQTVAPVFTSSAINAERPSSGSMPRSNWTMSLPSYTSSDVERPYMLSGLPRLSAQTTWPSKSRAATSLLAKVT